MGVGVPSAGRTRQLSASVYIERWVQVDIGPLIIYGEDGDLNRLDQTADTMTTNQINFKAPQPGECDAGETNPAWFGQVIRVPFVAVQPSGAWHLLISTLESFMATAFPDDAAPMMNQRIKLPATGTVESPAKFVSWLIEYQ